jgi:hypothetical protein
LTAIGDKACVTVVADEREQQEDGEDGTSQDPVATVWLACACGLRGRRRIGLAMTRGPVRGWM